MTPDEALQHRWVLEAAQSPATYRGSSKRPDQHTPAGKPQHAPAYALSKPPALAAAGAGVDWAGSDQQQQLLPSSYAAAQQWPQPQPMQVDTTRSTPRGAAVYHSEAAQQLAAAQAQLAAQASQQQMLAAAGSVHQQAVRSSLGPAQLQAQLQAQLAMAQPQPAMMELDPSRHQQQQAQQQQQAAQYQQTLRNMAAAPAAGTAAAGGPRSSDIGGLKMDQALQQPHSGAGQLGNSSLLQVRPRGPATA
jgi:hypothetical protein